MIVVTFVAIALACLLHEAHWWAQLIAVILVAALYYTVWTWQEH